MVPRLQTTRQPLDPRLIAITDRTRLDAASLLLRCEELSARSRPGSLLILLRDRQLPVRERLELGRKLRELTLAHGQALSVNDRLDVAALVGADAVHLSESSVAARDARQLLGAGCFLSRACHDITEFTRDGTELTALDAVLLSPMLAPRKGRPPLGVAALTEARRALDDAAAGRVRLYALGGVDATGAMACVTAGASGVAMIGAAFEGNAGVLLQSLGIAR